MKNFKNFRLLRFSFIAFISIIAFSSCTNDEDTAVSTVLKITSVSKALNSSTPSNPVDNDSITSIGFPNNTYIIRGSGFSFAKKIYFNDLESYLNPALITDNVMFVTINQDTPYTDVSNEIKLVSETGSVSYPFIIGPPAPQITRGFNPVNANEGDEITIYGNFFLDPVVTFGNISAEVVSNTLIEIVAKVPIGGDKKYITVKTISGLVTTTYAVGTALYDDVWYGGFGPADWNNHTYETDNTAAQGNVYFKKTMGGWDNIQGEWSWDDQISAYSGIRMSLKGDAGSKLKLVFNGNWSDDTAPIIILTGEWEEYYFSWADLGNADHVQNISFQEFTGNGGVYYFDNFGFFLNE